MRFVFFEFEFVLWLVALLVLFYHKIAAAQVVPAIPTCILTYEWGLLPLTMPERPQKYQFSIVHGHGSGHTINSSGSSSQGPPTFKCNVPNAFLTTRHHHVSSIQALVENSRSRYSMTHKIEAHWWLHSLSAFVSKTVQ